MGPLTTHKMESAKEQIRESLPPCPLMFGVLDEININTLTCKNVHVNADGIGILFCIPRFIKNVSEQKPEVSIVRT
jgi:hypothetical protein